MYIDLPERIGPMGIKTMKAFNRTKGEVFFLEISIKQCDKICILQCYETINFRVKII